MKAIFLDHDGVMCISGNWGSRHKKMKNWARRNPGGEQPPSWVRMDSFDPKAVKVLNDILGLTGAEIVVSSDWKLHCTLEELQEMFLKYGVSKAPIATTPNLDPSKHEGPEAARVAEIREWLANNPQVSRWLAIDDLDLNELGNFVRTTRMSEGIKQSGIKERVLRGLTQGD